MEAIESYGGNVRMVMNGRKVPVDELIKDDNMDAQNVIKVNLIIIKLEKVFRLVENKALLSINLILRSYKS